MSKRAYNRLMGTNIEYVSGTGAGNTLLLTWHIACWNYYNWKHPYKRRQLKRMKKILDQIK